MIAVLQTLTIAAAADAVLLVLVAPWRGTWANVTALALSGLAAIGAAMQVDEGQIALAWLAARVVTITLHMTASPVAHAREPSTGPFRRLQLGLRSSVAAATPERLSERVFRVAVAAVWLGIAAVVALRAFESGVVLDPIQACSTRSRPGPRWLCSAAASRPRCSRPTSIGASSRCSWH